MTQAPSCETCKDSRIIKVWHDMEGPCPDCQPKPSEGTETLDLLIPRIDAAKDRGELNAGLASDIAKRISQLEADLAAARLDAERCRQWFDAVQDLNHDFLDRDDYLLARKLYEQCGMRVPKSMEIAIAAGDGK